MNDISCVNIYSNGIKIVKIKKIFLTKDDIKYFFYKGKALLIQKVNSDEQIKIVIFKEDLKLTIEFYEKLYMLIHIIDKHFNNNYTIKEVNILDFADSQINILSDLNFLE